MALFSLTEEIRKALDNSNFACGIFIDLQKAFDTVDHHILLSKLEHYGIRGIANCCLKAIYLIVNNLLVLMAMTQKNKK